MLIPQARERGAWECAVGWSMRQLVAGFARVTRAPNPAVLPRYGHQELIAAHQPAELPGALAPSPVIGSACWEHIRNPRTLRFHSPEAMRRGSIRRETKGGLSAVPEKPGLLAGAHSLPDTTPAMPALALTPGSFGRLRGLPPSGRAQDKAGREVSDKFFLEACRDAVGCIRATPVMHLFAQTTTGHTCLAMVHYGLRPNAPYGISNPLHKALHHLLRAGFFEVDG